MNEPHGTGHRSEPIKVKSCRCGWPNLKEGEVMGTVPDLTDCPDCGEPLKVVEIPAGTIVPRKDFGPLKISDLVPPPDTPGVELEPCQELKRAGEALATLHRTIPTYNPRWLNALKAWDEAAARLETPEQIAAKAAHGS